MKETSNNPRRRQTSDTWSRRRWGECRKWLLKFTLTNRSARLTCRPIIPDRRGWWCRVLRRDSWTSIRVIPTCRRLWATIKTLRSPWCSQIFLPLLWCTTSKTRHRFHRLFYLCRYLRPNRYQLLAQSWNKDPSSTTRRTVFRYFQHPQDSSRWIWPADGRLHPITDRADRTHRTAIKENGDRTLRITERSRHIEKNDWKLRSLRLYRIPK